VTVSSDEAPRFLNSDRIVAEDGLWGEGDGVLADVGGDELVEERARRFVLRIREVAAWAVAP